MRFSILLSALAVITSASAVVVDSRDGGDGDGHGEAPGYGNGHGNGNNPGYGDDHGHGNGWGHGGGHHGWPPCIRYCMRNSYGCSKNDDKCVCSNAQWVSDNRRCFQQHCHGHQYDQASKAVLSMCNDCGSPISGW